MLTNRAAHPPPSSRRAILHNLRYDETLMTLHNASGAGTNADLYLTGSQAQAARQAAGGACTNIAFRTGEGGGCCGLLVLVLEEERAQRVVWGRAAGPGTPAWLWCIARPAAHAAAAAPAGAGVPLMAAGGGAGVVTVWDLEQRRLHTLVRDAHDAPLLSLHFFPGESTISPPSCGLCLLPPPAAALARGWGRACCARWPAKLRESHLPAASLAACRRAAADELREGQQPEAVGV